MEQTWTSHAGACRGIALARTRIWARNSGITPPHNQAAYIDHPIHGDWRPESQCEGARLLPMGSRSQCTGARHNRFPTIHIRDIGEQR